MNANAQVEVSAQEDEHDEDVIQEPCVRCVTLKLADEVYAIDVMKVKEVLRYTDIAPVPGAGEYVLGIMNLRGNVVTVIDGRKRMNLPPVEGDDATRIIIAKFEDEVLGIVVDSVAHVVDLPVSAIDTSPRSSQSAGSKYINGVVTHKGKLIIMIDIDMLISEGDAAANDKFLT